MKVGTLIQALGALDPNSEIKVASADEGGIFIEDLVKIVPGFNVLLLQTQSFMLELDRRAVKAGLIDTDSKPKLTLVN